MPKSETDWFGGESAPAEEMNTLRLETIGHLPAKRVRIHGRFPYDGFGLVLRGHGAFQVGDGPVHDLIAPAVFFVWPGAVFRYGPRPGTTWEERFICFTGPRVKEWRRWGWLSREPFTLAEPAQAIEAHQRICRAFPPFAGASLAQAKLDTEQLIYALHRQKTSAAIPDELDALIAAWRQTPAAPHDLRAAAQKLGISYSGFRAHFTRRTGLTPYQFLLRLRLDRAALLLAQTRHPVKSIAFTSGFASAESFHRAFRQTHHLSPLAYRHRATLPARG